MEADGVLLIDKPSGCTSHDVVDYVRNRFHFKKVGHCGTLDPLATGLLMLVIGKATKIQDLLMAEDKEYAGDDEARRRRPIRRTPTARSLEEKPVPELTREQLEAAFKKYTGDFYQMPPMVSALKQGGVPLYKLARAGKTVEREPRLVHISSYIIDEVALPLVKFRIQCSKGFYVRTYCHDIGARPRLRRASGAAEPAQVGQLFARARAELGRAAKNHRRARAAALAADPAGSLAPAAEIT